MCMYTCVCVCVWMSCTQTCVEVIRQLCRVGSLLRLKLRRLGFAAAPSSVRSPSDKLDTLPDVPRVPTFPVDVIVDWQKEAIPAFMKKCCDETWKKSWFSDLHAVDPLSRGNCTCALNGAHFRNPSWSVQWFFFEFLPPCFLPFKVTTENIKRASKGTHNTFLSVFITCVSERQPRRGKILFFHLFNFWKWNS